MPSPAAPPAPHGLARVVSAISTGISLLCRGILVLMILQICVDVAMRYVFDISLPGTIAFVSNYYMIAITFLPLAVAERENRHIDVEVLTTNLPATAQAALRLVAWIVCCAIFALMTRESFVEAVEAMHSARYIIENGMKLPVWPSHFILPVGFGAVALVCLSRIVITLLALRIGLTAAVDRARRYYQGDHDHE
ncbi:TRAP transporter small permease [Salipiger sp.]|uniref:TRAP transporter small permease n=1 Tax=Salipiger sp. TaxID=2078585 RepID=UPI003A974D44